MTATEPGLLAVQTATATAAASLEEATRTATVLAAVEGEPFTQSAGERLLWKLPGDGSPDSFDLFEVIADPFTLGPPEHIHDLVTEIFYVLAGTLRVKLGTTITTATTGAVVHIPRGTSHTWNNAGHTALRMLTVYLPGGMRGFFEATGPLVQAQPLDLQALAAAAGHFQTRLSGTPLPPQPVST